MLYFAGNPIAIWRKVGTGASTMTRLITDHLGTPVASVFPNGSGVDWVGGFTPWGEDWQRGTSQDSLSKGIFLRLPGQWKDPTWSTTTYPFELFYNLHRWYDPATGRYVSVDPWQEPVQARPLYAYVTNRPLSLTDPLGLRQFPFGAGQFCRDRSCRCPVWPPVKVLAEDKMTFYPTMELGCVDADAVYMPRCILKIPDNYSCVLKCEPEGSIGQEIITCRPKGFFFGLVTALFFGKKPECLSGPPTSWPANPY